MWSPISGGRNEAGAIDRITRTGIAMQDGWHIDAEIIVKATGLDVVLGGEAAAMRSLRRWATVIRDRNPPEQHAQIVGRLIKSNKFSGWWHRHRGLGSLLSQAF
ncbi:hypothetical protein GCM10011610_26360 [Nocardia rhizosphaerihabitans]|uniref:Uncharacterized protein n=1 Tax=Nocardia rhizosphaerihabitans TaxID=1691570 RepID=A0ABQ2KBY5_9NOCA|nr:hypothetical protein GCM10011610_26360 [Nocardia rhizosphaerihabitans]